MNSIKFNLSYCISLMYRKHRRVFHCLLPFSVQCSPRKSFGSKIAVQHYVHLHLDDVQTLT